MATLAERNPSPEPPTGRGQQPESWGLLLIPVLLCIGMLIYALATEAPAPTDVPRSSSCVSPNQPRPSGDC